MNNKTKNTVAFIDAANLFYGGVKSLGWKIDYQKLLQYLKEKYGISEAFYYAGIEIYNFPYSVFNDEPINLKDLLKFLQDQCGDSDNIAEMRLMILERNMKRIKFYLKLKEFGYTLKLKPTKIYFDENNIPKKKANCDVDMTFGMMKMIGMFKRAVVLSGDGDFAVILKYLISQGKEIIILSRNERTAKEIRQLAKGNFRDFHKLRHKIEFFDKKRERPAKDLPHV